MFDMHNIWTPLGGSEDNDGLGPEVWKEQMISDAWVILAQRYCAYPNVIMADVRHQSSRKGDSQPLPLLPQPLFSCSLSHSSHHPPRPNRENDGLLPESTHPHDGFCFCQLFNEP